MLFFLGLFLTTANAHKIEGNPSKVDLTKSTVNWKAYKVTGEHEGDVTIKSADLDIENGQLRGGSFVIDVTTLKSTDLSGTWADKLNGHLKSADFFDVENHPTASFNITNVEAASNGGQFNVTGDMTIKGITKSITFPASITSNSAKAEIKVDRTDFDVRYGSGKFFENLGDKTIDDEFDLIVNLVF